MKKKDLFRLILCVLGIFLITMLINGIYPFGSNDLAISDAAAQYEPFLYDYITRLKSFSYYNYSFMNFLGNPAMFNFVYYLASPLNLIAMLFSDYRLMFLSVVIIKLIVASLSSYYFFSKYDSMAAIIASLCYVYSGWFLAYYFNIMWLDGFMMFPLLVIGVQNILKNNPAIYILTLSYIYISNFYIGYMLSFFVLVYYLFKLITMKEKYAYKIRNFLYMIFYTGLVVGISFFHIYNVYNIIGKTKLVSYNYENPLIFTDFISGLFSGNVSALFVSVKDYANVCVSVFALMGALSYFFNKNISKKDKICNFVLVVILLITLFSSKINFVISGFTVPAGMPLRYSFIFSFLLIYLAFKNYIKESINLFNYLFASVYLVIVLYFYFKELISLNIFILNIVMIAIYFGYLIFHKKKFTRGIAIIAIIAECTFSLCINIKGTSELTDSNFYDSSYSFSYFSSMIYREPLNFVGGLGVSTDYKAKVKRASGIVLEIMQKKVFGASNDIKNFSLGDNYINNRNNYISSLTGTDNVFVKGNYTTTINGNLVSYKVKDDGLYYYELSNNQYYVLWNDNIYLATDDKNILPDNYKDYNTSSSAFSSLLVFDLKKNDEVIICYSDGNYHDLFTEDKVLIENAIKTLEKYELQYDVQKDNYLSGSIDLDDNMIIYTTIPFDESWVIKLDGKKVSPIHLEGDLMGIEASPGKHYLELEYDDVKIWPFVISLVSVGVFIIVIKKNYKANL